MIRASHNPKGYTAMNPVPLNVETRRAANTLSQHLTRVEALIQEGR